MTFALSAEETATPFKGPTLLATLLYIACFAIAVPACGMSRRFFSRRRRTPSVNGSGSLAGASSNNGAKRRSWILPLGKGGGGGGGGGGRAGANREGEDMQEMVPLAREEDGEWGRERAM